MNQISSDGKSERKIIMSRTESLAELFSKNIKSTYEEEKSKDETEYEAKKILNHFQSLDNQELFN